MIVWSMLSACWFLSGEVVEGEIEASPAPIVTEVRPIEAEPIEVRPIAASPELTIAPEPCSEERFNEIVRSSSAIAEPLRGKARVLRPICEGDFAYGVTAIEGAPEGGPPVTFLRTLKGWKLLDLGDIDCEMPAEPMTPRICASLQARWK